jgi:hypothetical protein
LFGFVCDCIFPDLFLMRISFFVHILSFYFSYYPENNWCLQLRSKGVSILTLIYTIPVFTSSILDLLNNNRINPYFVTKCGTSKINHVSLTYLTWRNSCFPLFTYNCFIGCWGELCKSKDVLLSCSLQGNVYFHHKF